MAMGAGRVCLGTPRAGREAQARWRGRSGAPDGLHRAVGSNPGMLRLRASARHAGRHMIRLLPLRETFCREVSPKGALAAGGIAA
ncbi:hypothetical protein RSP03_39390 [Cereibacter sphaeroides]|nr:hypothetical protein RSP03_39390 [Cereibacter sphaeroides]